MMSIPSEASTVVCSHCKRSVPAQNIDLHYAHCSRYLERCIICNEMIPKKHAKEHHLSSHAPVACSQCNEIVERKILALHKDENCPQRIVTCEYCEFPLPAVDLGEHQQVCGNRTEFCTICNKYIRLHERNDHEVFHTRSHHVAESSRIQSIHESIEDRPRRPMRNLSKKHLLFTVAVTGAAVVVGSMLLQRKADSHPLQ